MASKIKVDQIQTADGTGTIALQNQLSGMTDASLPSGKILQTVTANILGTTTTTSSSFGSTVVAATYIGFPISTTHTLVGAVIGVGLAKGVSHLDLGSIGRIVLSWVVTIPAGASLTILFYFILKTVFGV